jgi:hypothetical protein
MENEHEVIRQKMCDTRASLQDKLETLEQHVTGTVQGAAEAATETVQNVKETVQETVNSVKGAVQDTVDTVKETFDLRRQVAAHPWEMVIGAALVGFAGTRLLLPARRPPSGPPVISERVSGGPMGGPGRPHRNGAGTPIEDSERRGFLGAIGEHYGDEINKLQGLAIGAFGAIVRDVVASFTPPALTEQVTDVVDSITAKLGGKTIHGPLLKGSASQSPAWQSRYDRSNSVEPLTP